jgi:galactose mutarotase-like enzyme
VVTPLETVILRDGDTEVALAPSRGGIATRMSVGGRPVFFLDEATLLDETRNIRGGNPVLFPSPGPLTGDEFTYGGRWGRMKQHGLARQRPWFAAASDGSAATLVLASDASTILEFPWDFTLAFTYAVTPGRLTITQRVENRSIAPMPFALGFHPYFAVADADKAQTSVPTRATRAWDNVLKREVELSGPIELAGREVDLHLIDHGSNQATLALADGARVVIAGSEAFKRWVVWTLPGKDFVCVEPWTAAVDALNTGKDLLLAAPGEAMELEVTIALER